MPNKVTIGLLGCGTVGTAVLRLLADHGDKLAGRVGGQLEVKRVLVRDTSRERPGCDPALLTDKADEVLNDPAIDLVVELMGGADEARDYVKRALDARKGVVSANKLLLALHSSELLRQARDARVDLAFEGAVGGGIPIVRTLREAFSSDRVTAITGIVNGTSNYVLTRMLDDGLSMAEAVVAAQELGYAETEPSMDVDGHDAAHKLNLLALLGFGAKVSTDQIHTEGIGNIETTDHRLAHRFGYRIKPLAIGRDHGDGVELRVHPALIPERSVLANVSGVLNAALLEGKALGPCMLYGRGAGGLPTAVSVVADILDVARSIAAGASGLQTRSIAYEERPVRPMDALETRYYIRFTVGDRPGVMARLAGSLGDVGVSIEQMVQAQKPTTLGGSASVVMLTHIAQEGAVRKALEVLSKEDFMAMPPRLLRIEDV